MVKSLVALVRKITATSEIKESPKEALGMFRHFIKEGNGEVLAEVLMELVNRTKNCDRYGIVFDQNPPPHTVQRIINYIRTYHYLTAPKMVIDKAC